MAHTEAASVCVCEQSVCWHTLVISLLVRHGVFEGFFYISHLIFSVQNSRGTKRCQTRADLTGQRKLVCVCVCVRGLEVIVHQWNSRAPLVSSHSRSRSCHIYTVRINAQRYASAFVKSVNINLKGTVHWKIKIQDLLLTLMLFQDHMSFFKVMTGSVIKV